MKPFKRRVRPFRQGEGISAVPGGEGGKRQKEVDQARPDQAGQKYFL